jgi:hypothetical protein
MTTVESQWCHRPCRCPPQARDAFPDPTTPSSSPILCHSWAHDAIDSCRPPARNDIVLLEPTTSLFPWCPRARNTVEPVSSFHPQRCRPPQAQNATLYIFLCHFGPTNPDFDMLVCYIATLFWCTTLSHWFDMLHCFCSATLLWHATFPRCFDMLHCFCSAALLWYAI